MTIMRLSVTMFTGDSSLSFVFSGMDHAKAGYTRVSMIDTVDSN